MREPTMGTTQKGFSGKFFRIFEMNFFSLLLLYAT